MWTRIHSFGLAALLAVFGLGLASAPADAQTRLNGPTIVRNRQPINPNWLVAPGITLRQWAYNTRMMGNAYSSIPPYMLGYNPYPQILNYGPTYPYAVNPYLSYPSLYYNPYGGLYANPYNPYALYGSSYLFQ